jgi:hypothetical protein
VKLTNAFNLARLAKLDLDLILHLNPCCVKHAGIDTITVAADQISP